MRPDDIGRRSNTPSLHGLDDWIESSAFNGCKEAKSVENTYLALTPPPVPTFYPNALVRFKALLSFLTMSNFQTWFVSTNRRFIHHQAVWLDCSAEQ